MPRKLTKDEFIRRSIESHPDTRYGYDKVEFHNLRDTVLIYCPDCEDYFEQEAMRHLRGSGCPRCTFRKQSEKRKHPQKSRKLDTEEFLRRVSEIPELLEKFDFSKVECTNAFSPIEVFCKTCKEYFSTNPARILRGHGCPECAKRIKSEKVKYD